MTRRLLPLLLVALTAAAVAIPATASAARTKIAVGIGDQNPQMFANPLYQQLKLKKTRYFIHWDAAIKPAELAKADAFVAAARASRVKVLMHISTNTFQPGARLPSVAQYKAAVRALIARYRPQGVREWGVWNEANHKTQPTFRSPTRAASFYKTMRSICKGCSIVALDVLDQRGVESYIRRWFKAAGSVGRRATIIGIHNYSEVNRRLGERRSRKSFAQYPGTTRIIRAVRRAKNSRAKFWFTETGGLVNFASFKCDQRRPVSRNKFMFQLARKHRRSVTRLYTYNWTGADCNGFDAGLVNNNGTPRPGYAPFKRELRNFTR